MQHMDFPYFFISERFEKGEIEIQKYPAECMVEY